MMTFPLDSIRVLGNASTDGEPYFYPNEYGAAYYVDSTEYNGRKALSIGGMNAAFGDSDAIDSNGDVWCAPCSYVLYPQNNDWENGIPMNTNFNSPSQNYNFILNDSLKKTDYFLTSVCSGYSLFAEGLGLIANLSDCGLSMSSIFMVGYRKGEEEYGTIYPLEDILNGVTEISKIDVKIFPNPADDFFVVAIPESYTRPFTISIMDISGREVFRESGLKGNRRIDTENLASGVYVLHGENKDYTFAQKVVIR